MSDRKIPICILSVLLICFAIWFIWPAIVGFHPKVNLEDSSAIGIAVFSQLYTVLQALVAMLSIGTAFVMYYLGKKQARDDDFNKLQMNEIEHLFKAINEWAKLQDELKCSIDGKVVDGYFVAEALEKKYRRAELRLLVRIIGKDNIDSRNAQAELDKLDEAFLEDCKNANLKPSADALFRILNWAWAIIGSFERVYSKDESRIEQVKDFQEKLIGIIRDYIGLNWQFVYGKYRHLKWELDKNWPEIYRGESSADRLFAYERTLSKYVPSLPVQKLQLNDLEKRNELLKLRATERLDLSEWWKQIERRKGKA